MQKVVGLLGVKGAGKDTAASVLVAERQYRRIGFADKLYEEAAAAFKVTVAFMGNRDTKEKDLPELSLQNCNDMAYVACVAHALQGDQHLSAEQLAAPRSPRFILQYWGTEYRRRGLPGVYAGDDSYWLNTVKAAILDSPHTSFVVTDVRFLNEFNFVRNLGGILARVRRPALEAVEALERAKNGTAAHGSETELLTVSADVELSNPDGQLTVLREAVLAMDDAFVTA
jgi:hypothetical protein